MAAQTYANHTRYSPPFHFVLIPVLTLTLIGSIVNLSRSWDDHERLYSAALIVVLCAAALLLDRGLLVREVGQQVGYEDPYHFSKVFKRVYSLSPEAFRSRGRV